MMYNVGAQIQKILVGLEGTEAEVSQLALALALEHRASLHLLHVAPQLPRFRWQSSGLTVHQLHERNLAACQSRLAFLADEVRQRGIQVEAQVRVGRAHVEIIEEALAERASLVIVHDRPKAQGRAFGSVTTKLLRECPVPVLAERSTRKAAHECIVAAVDVEPSPSDKHSPNMEIIEAAASLARRSTQKLVVFHAWQVWGEHLLEGIGGMMPNEIEELLALTKRRHQDALDSLLRESDVSGLEVVVELRHGDAHDEVTDLVRQADVDLLVMGSVARTGLQRLVVGNTAEKILNELSCSVLVVKS